MHILYNKYFKYYYFVCICYLVSAVWYLLWLWYCDTLYGDLVSCLELPLTDLYLKAATRAVARTAEATQRRGLLWADLAERRHSTRLRLVMMTPVLSDDILLIRSTSVLSDICYLLSTRVKTTIFAQILEVVMPLTSHLYFSIEVKREYISNISYILIFIIYLFHSKLSITNLFLRFGCDIQGLLHTVGSPTEYLQYKWIKSKQVSFYFKF